MCKKIIPLALSALLFALCISAEAQQAKVYRVGVLVPGEAWYEIIDGLRVGLRQLGSKRENNLLSQSEIGRAM